MGIFIKFVFQLKNMSNKVDVVYGGVSKKDFEKSFLNWEFRLNKSVLEGAGDESLVQKVRNFFTDKTLRYAFYDNILISLTNKNYDICNKLSKRLVSPYEFGLPSD